MNLTLFCRHVFGKSPTGCRLFVASRFSTDVTSGDNTPLFDYAELARRALDRSSALVDPGSIYKTYPNAKRALIGKRPKIRFVWEEQDCSESFPASPQEANLDVLHFLEQRDMWRRRKQLQVPEFCVGSVIAVTRGDRLSPVGWSRFVGLCVSKNYTQNTKGANFILRNVILDEPLEIQYPIYSPLIQKIEVLRHERWENEKPYTGLRFLRDYPPTYSTVDENMEADEYTTEPKVRKWTKEDKERIKAWFEAVYESRRRR